MDHLYQEVLGKVQEQVVDPLSGYVAQFPDIKARVEKRERRALDYQRTKRALDSAREKPVRWEEKIRVCPPSTLAHHPHRAPGRSRRRTPSRRRRTPSPPSTRSATTRCPRSTMGVLILETEDGGRSANPPAPSPELGASPSTPPRCTPTARRRPPSTAPATRSGR